MISFTLLGGGESLRNAAQCSIVESTASEVAGASSTTTDNWVQLSIEEDGTMLMELIFSGLKGITVGWLTGCNDGLLVGWIDGCFVGERRGWEDG